MMSIFQIIKQLPERDRLDTLNTLFSGFKGKSFKEDDFEIFKKFKDKFKTWNINPDDLLNHLAILCYRFTQRADIQAMLLRAEGLVDIQSLIPQVEVEESPSAGAEPLPALRMNALELFRRIFGDLSDAALLVNSETTILSMNPSAQSLFGFESVDPEVYSIQVLSPARQPGGSSSKMMLIKVMESVTTEPHQQFSWTCMTLSGELFACQITLTQLKAEDGEAIIAVVKREAEKKQATGSGYSESLIMNGWPYILMASRRIVEINDLAVAMLGGKSSSDFLNKGLADIKPEEQPSGEKTDHREMRKVMHVTQNGRSIFYQILQRMDRTPLHILMIAQQVKHDGVPGVSAQFRILSSTHEIQSSQYIQWIDRHIQSVEAARNIAPTFEERFFWASHPEFVFEMDCDDDSDSGSQISYSEGASVSQTYGRCSYPIKAANQQMLFLSRSAFDDLIGALANTYLKTESEVNKLGVTSGRPHHLPGSGSGSGSGSSVTTIVHELATINEIARPQQVQWYWQYPSESSAMIRPLTLDITLLKLGGKSVYHARVIGDEDIIEGSYVVMH